ALGSPDDAASDLLRAAELAMRRAKWGGDPAVAIADEELLGRRLRPDLPITAQLRRALERDELVIHYQPFVSISSGEIVGAEALAEANVDPGRLLIELTEGAVMDFASDAPTALADIAGLGVRIALDDFGAGHSSLAHLRDFPLHVVKVDKSFVAGVVTRRSDQ